MPDIKKLLSLFTTFVFRKILFNSGFVKLFCQYSEDRRASTAMEYALMAAGIGISLILVFTAIGDEIYNVFNTIETQMGTPQDRLSSG